MLIIKNKNDGFTLIELIIVISIFSTMIFLGYNILNESNKRENTQKEIYNEQQTANLVNKYLSMDLEQCKEFKDADTNLNTYKYIINENSNPIEYEVSLGSNKYTVTRKYNGNIIKIIDNMPMSGGIPFTIEQEDNTKNIFTVKLNSKDNSNTKYEFNVASRFKNDDNNNLPEIDSISPNGKIGYEYYKLMGQNNSNKIQITVRGIQNDIAVETLSPPVSGNSNKTEFEIYAEVPVGHDNNGKLGATMKGIGENSTIGNSSKIGKEKWNTFGKNLNVDNITINVGTGIVLTNLTIEGNILDRNVQYGEGTYYFENKVDKKEIAVQANMKIIDSNVTESSAVEIKFGKSK